MQLSAAGVRIFGFRAACRARRTHSLQIALRPWPPFQFCGKPRNGLLNFALAALLRSHRRTFTSHRFLQHLANVLAAAHARREGQPNLGVAEAMGIVIGASLHIDRLGVAVLVLLVGPHEVLDVIAVL